MKSFSSKIINWYEINKRDLPWRRTKDPYWIWLSEIILQQTRVDQGMSYYLRFIEEFPTIAQLADASEETVLKLWQGLGYYSRARNLHGTAKHINENLSARFPSEHTEILKLKGVGEYTAAAIASFAFGQCYPVVDGNVYRVLSRVFGIKTPIDSSSGKKEFYALANILIDPAHPALYNQSIMEFGAIQCKPKNPDCSNCPLITMCAAFADNIIEELPIKSKTIKQRDRFFNYLVFKHKNNLILNKRSEKDIWKNLYDFPMIESAHFITETEFLGSGEWRNMIGEESYNIMSVSKVYKHVLSHQKIYARFWEISLSKKTAPTAFAFENSLSIKQKDLHKYPIPRLLEIYLETKTGISLDHFIT